MSFTILYSIISGMVVSISPCIIILLPLIFYRFFSKEKHQILNFGMFIFGFILGFVFLGIIISRIFSSSLRTGFMVGLGILFIVLGILGAMKKVNPLNLKIIKNPVIFGIIIVFIAVTSPCSLPYLGVIISLSGVNAYIHLIAFGIGILIPGIIFAVVGQNLLNFARSSHKFSNLVERMMHLILIASGLYLLLTIKMISSYDFLVIGGMMVFVFLIIIRSFFIINKKKDLFKLRNIILIFSLILLILSSIGYYRIKLGHERADDYFNLENEVASFGTNPSQEVCVAEEHCAVCMLCAFTFLGAALLGLIGVYLSNRIQSKNF